jgi:hypothetical protein
MLTSYIQGKFVQKILISPTGEQFRVLFLITLINGEVRAQIVSAEPLIVSNRLLMNGYKQSNASNQFLLATSTQKKIQTEYIPSYVPVISPYIELYFFTSQPTRAPSFA